MSEATPIGFDPFGVDAVTIIVAVLAAAVAVAVRYFRGFRPVTTRRRFINDFLNASVIYPFFLLILSVGSQSIFEYIREAKLAVGLAGMVGIVFVVGELVLSCSDKNGEIEPPV